MDKKVKNLLVLWVMMIFITLSSSCNSDSQQKEGFNPFEGPDPSRVYDMYDITKYATAAHHEKTIKEILYDMPRMRTVGDVDRYIKKIAKKSPVTGEMVVIAAKKYRADIHMMLAIMQMDSHFGTKGLGARTKNPGNVGNNGVKITYYSSWQDGVHVVAHWLARKRK